MLEYPKWKFVVVGVALLLALLYAIPNVFQPQPALQIAPNRGAVIDDVLVARVEGNLQGKKIAFGPIERDDKRLQIRFDSTDVQLAAADALKADPEIANRYTVALTQASTVPSWLQAIGGRTMALGLDLRGGVHFLMEVDASALQKTLEDRLQSDLYAVLREKELAYTGVQRVPAGLLVAFAAAADRTAAFDALLRGVPDCTFEEVGDTELICRMRPEKLNETADHAVEQNIATLRNRINELGVAEPLIQRQGMNRIVVQLPGVQDPTIAKRILGATATLEYRAVDVRNDAALAAETGKIPPESRLYRERGSNRPVLLSKTVIASGDNLVNATSGVSQEDGSPMVSVTLDAAGGARMLEFTTENVGRPMAVVFKERKPVVRVVDGKEVREFEEVEEVISIATIRGVFGRQFQTTGLDSPQEAKELAVLLRAGALAAPVDIIEERVIGPSLGQDNIERGRNAIIAGFVATMAFMVVYYKTFGVIAVLGLLANVLVLIAVLSPFGVTLTMPGIAGIALTLGMAVDANVLINERIREELRNGNSPLSSIHAGYEKAWSTIIDANITTLIAGIALFAFGSGPIRGFAVVLCAGILTTMFSAVTVTYAIVCALYGHQRKLKHVSI